MALHQAFRARPVRNIGIGGGMRHGVTSGVSCETSLKMHVTPHLHREYLNIHIYIYIYICFYIHIYTYIPIHIHTYTYIYIHIHIHTCIGIMLCMYNHNCICINIIMYTHICVYIHTYSRILPRSSADDSAGQLAVVQV